MPKFDKNSYSSETKFSLSLASFDSDEDVAVLFIHSLSETVSSEYSINFAPRSLHIIFVDP
jgi:hypothetical protein